MTILGPENLVKISGLSFSYGEREVLADINLKFPKGKVVAIMGASGSGKTTILRLIGGQLRAKTGDVVFDNKSVRKMGHEALFASRRRMGMLFQHGALFTGLSAFENVAFPLREHTDLTEDMLKDFVFMKLQAVGLRGAHGLMPSELSGGMARRVALARAIALDPELIMYDEPFTGLDPISTAVIANLIRRLNDALGATSILVTHDVEASLKIVDFVYFLADGELIGQGTPEEVRSSSNPRLKQFINGQIDGPVPLHYPARSYEDDLGLDNDP